jgi:hypothetical protein
MIRVRRFAIFGHLDEAKAWIVIEIAVYFSVDFILKPRSILK